MYASHWITTGATASGFRVFVYYTVGTMTPAQANAAGWHINWLATPNPTVAANLCSGQTSPSSSNWQVYNSSGLYLDVNTTACGLSNTPLYLTSLGGNSSHWVTEGATSIYSPTPTGFRVYVFYRAGTITPAEAVASGWHINWVAVSGNYHTLHKYYYAGAQRVALRQNNRVYWLLRDHLGSTAYTVNGTTETGEVRYYTWGKDRNTNGQTLTSYKFTGQREEAGLGLYYYGARAPWAPDKAPQRRIIGCPRSADTLVPRPMGTRGMPRVLIGTRMRSTIHSNMLIQRAIKQPVRWTPRTTCSVATMALPAVKP